MWGLYRRPDEDAPVALLANPEDRAAYERKGFVFLVECPSPGTATDAEMADALKKAAKVK